MLAERARGLLSGEVSRPEFANIAVPWFPFHVKSSMRGLEPERCGSPFLFDRVKKLGPFLADLAGIEHSNAVRSLHRSRSGERLKSAEKERRRVGGTLAAPLPTRAWP